MEGAKPWSVPYYSPAIRRRTQRGLKLEPQLELIEGDVVVLIGTAAAVTAGEEILLRGKQK